MRRVHIAKVPAILVTCSALVFSVTGPAWAANNVVLSPYVPFPKAALIGVGGVFAKPTHAQVANVRVSVARAYKVSLTQVGTLPKGAKVTLRLGLFSDTMQGRKAGVLSYAVIFDGVEIPSTGPITGHDDHELIVIVNATTGRSVQAFSYR